MRHNPTVPPRHAPRALRWLVACAIAHTSACTPSPAQTPDEAPTTPVVAVPDIEDTPAEALDEPSGEEEGYCDVACREHGLCEIRDGSCTATSDAHCRDAAVCAQDGRCHVDDGGCVARDTGATLAAGAICQQLIDRLRSCKAPAGSSASFDSAIAALEKAMLSPSSETVRAAFEKSCSDMMRNLAGSAICP